MTLVITSLAPDAAFLQHVAEEVLAFAGRHAHPADLSSLSFILPNLKLAPPLSTQLARCAGKTLLLPRMLTFAGFVDPWLAPLQALPDARRQLLLHAQLRHKDWFDEALLWDVVSELTQLFDALTESHVALPSDQAELLACLERGFELHDSTSLSFEAKLVNTLWLAEAQGRPSRVAARLIAARQAVDALDGPLVVMAEQQDYSLIHPMLEHAATRVPVLLIVPDRAMATDEVSRLLAAAWPQNAAQNPTEPLYARMQGFDLTALQTFQQHVGFMACDSLEALGQAVADQVLDWLHAGKRDIALIAADRLAARRARALLERKGVLVLDETGWKMSTTRVAAVVDAWLEVLTTDAYHRALIDLLRAPILFEDIPADQRRSACHQIERLILEKNLPSGLDRLRAELGPQQTEAISLLERLREARQTMGSHQTCGLAEWLRRLEKCLTQLGAGEAFARDLVGRQWGEWLQVRMAELAGDEETFSFASWRMWFNRQMDSVLFRDESISSPVIMTHLAATRLRPFDAAIVIGADSEHMAPPSAPGWLSHAGVRRQLGLPGLEVLRQQIQEDLAGLLLTCGQSVIAWQAVRRDEELMPAAEVAVLTTAIRQLTGKNPVQHPRRAPVVASEEVTALPMPSPSIPDGRVPAKLSASALQTLVSCPYRYFARYVLRLAEQDELSEGMEKNDFGEQIHLILHQFHARFPVLSDQDDALLLQELSGITEAAFAAAVARNFQDHAWRLRWVQRLAQYIAWQRDRETQGWRWQAGEFDVAREHELGAGHTVTLRGRIDRMDQRNGEGGQALAVLDYKSRNQNALKRQAADPDDVQLAFYALLQGTHVAEAAYVALDDQQVVTVGVEDPEQRAGALQDCIDASFAAMYAGEGLPANGTDSACAWCEMRGLCRKEWQA